MDVIDLTSSSPPPAVRSSKPTKTDKPVSRTTRNILAVTNPPGNASKGRKTKDRWHCMSDGSQSDPFASPSVIAGSELGCRAKSSLTKPTSDGSGNWDKDFWSPQALKISNAFVSWEDSAGSASVTPGACMEANLKGDDDLFCVPRDYETYISLHHSGNENCGPSSKRRKLSPELESGISTKTMATKGKGLIRSSSDVGALSRSNGMGLSRSVSLKQSNTSIMEDDPIFFTSSPDAVRVAREKKKKKEKWTYGYELIDDYGNGSNDDLDSFGGGAGRKVVINVDDRKPKNVVEDISSDLELPDIGTMACGISSSAIHSCSHGNAREALAAYNAVKAADIKTRAEAGKTKYKTLTAQEKLEAKEAEKKRRKLEKEEKAREKQKAADLAKVNTLRTDKKVSTPEMIIDLPADLEERLAGNIRQFLGPLEVECRQWNSPIPNVVKWRRKVEAVYNEEMGHWEPAARTIKEDKHVLCFMGGKEFVDLTMGEEGKDLDAHLLNMKAKFDDCKIIYLIEGLVTWMRKNRNVKNRAFTEAVRIQMANEGVDLGTSSQRPKKRKAQEYVDEDMIEDSLLRLQVIHNTLIYHTAATIETAEWITVFTQHISTIPYKHASLAQNTTFCMAPGQVSIGISVPDTFLKMLQEVNRITAPIAYGIAAEYPTATTLVAGFKEHGKDALMDLRKSANKDGAFTDRRVGPSVSKRLWGIFMGKEEGSSDV